MKKLKRIINFVIAFIKGLPLAAKYALIYAYKGYRKWTTPRTYMFLYSYRDLSGELIVDSHLARGVNFDTLDVLTYLRRVLKGKGEIHILGIQEVPTDMYMLPVIDAAKKLVDKMDKIADDLPNQLKAVNEQAKQQEQEEEDEDPDFKRIFG